MKQIRYILLLTIVIVAACEHSSVDYTLKHEDKDAKEMLQGVWMDDDEGNPVIYAYGDSILYPDTSSLPVKFWIYKDSLYIQGYNLNRYKITKQSEHVFRFVNHSGDEVKLLKTDDQFMLEAFRQDRPYALNIFRTTDIDTIGCGGDVDYHCNIHIEPTSDRIIASSYNEQGVEVENMYLDNGARLNVVINGKMIYSHNFLKQEFSAYVPQEFMKGSILREIQYNHADTSSVYLDAIIGIPDAATSYVVELKITKNGKLTTRLK